MLIGRDGGHFLVIRRAWLLDADWLSTPALSWFPASNRLQTDFKNEFQKRITSEFDLNTVISSYKHERESMWNNTQSFGRGVKGFFQLKMYWFTAWKMFECRASLEAECFASQQLGKAEFDFDMTDQETHVAECNRLIRQFCKELKKAQIVLQPPKTKKRCVRCVLFEVMCSSQSWQGNALSWTFMHDDLAENRETSAQRPGERICLLI